MAPPSFFAAIQITKARAAFALWRHLLAVVSMSVGEPSKEIFHPAYRPGIDGLRAIAILSVVIFHAFPTVMHGGFVGVDIFFVISGYLISGIIFRNLHKDAFSFRDFYARRIKRIFPALIVVLAAAYIAGWFLLLPDEYRLLGKHVAASAGFIENFALRYEAGYFDTSSSLKPLMHLWSLAIEEQFYLIFPILIWAAWRLGINIFTLVLVLGIASFVANVLGIQKDAVRTFFIPGTRFWELLAGSVSAYVHAFRLPDLSSPPMRWFFDAPVSREPKVSSKVNASWSAVLSVAGLMVIVLAALLIPEKAAFPGWWAMVPVAGAVLLILAGPQALVNRYFLASKPMVFIGIISYPLYLWHWPLLSFARIVRDEPPSFEYRVCAVIVSFLLAWLTYRLVEKPIRFGHGGGAKTTALVASASAVGFVGLATFNADGLEFRLDDEAARIARAVGEWGYPGNLARHKLGKSVYYAQQSNKPQTTLFLGDSNVEQYYPRIDQRIRSAPDDTNSVIFMTGGGCLPVPGISYDSGHGHCVILMEDTAKLLDSMADIKTVVIAAQWNGYLAHGYGLQSKFDYGSEPYNAAFANLAAYIRNLIGRGKDVFVILNIPIARELDPKFMVQRDLSRFPNVFQVRKGGIDRSAFDASYGQIQTDLAEVAAAAGATVIKPVDVLCGRRCEALDEEGEPMYKDIAHLRSSFVRNKANFLDVTVR